MTKYLSYVGHTYEVLAEYGEFYWTLEEGTEWPNTLRKDLEGLKEVIRLPKQGEVWTEQITGLDVIVLGQTADGRTVVVPVKSNPGDTVGTADPANMKPTRRPVPPVRGGLDVQEERRDEDAGKV